MDWFLLPTAREKIADLPRAAAEALDLPPAAGSGRRDFPIVREMPIVSPSKLPDKLGLSSVEGQARLVHDLGSIEMQAMELALRSLYEYPEAPVKFRRELADLALEEGRHLELCLDAIEALGYKWGSWDVHTVLWNAVSSEDTLLDRVLIVHRYLEGSGLDAGDKILGRLSGVKAPVVQKVVATIVRDELGHVSFGSRWYRSIALDQGIDPDTAFEARIGRIAALAPRNERLNYDLRTRAGFTPREISALEKLIKR